MSKTDMSEFWMSPENLKELRLTFKDHQKPLEEMANILLYHVVHGNLPREGEKIAPLKDGKKGNSRHFCGPQQLEDLTQSYSY